MRKSIFIAATLMFIISVSFAQTTVDLNGATFGFGAGPSYSFGKTYDYSLTTDATHALKLQPLSQQAFVISSVISIKLSKISFDHSTNNFVKQSAKSQYSAQKKTTRIQDSLTNDTVNQLTNALVKLSPGKDSLQMVNTKKRLASAKARIKTNDSTLNKAQQISFWDHLSINLGIDLANVTSNVSFNKNVSGGVGLGYFITDNLQVGLFYDISQLSQMRDYVVSTYQDKPIPNGKGTYYTSLSTTDNNLFYNKTISALSFKLIFSIGNQKASTTTSN